MTSLLPSPELQFCDNNGVPLAGGSLAFYIPTTRTFKNTWQDSGQVTLNTNPITLDAGGRCIVFGDGDYEAVLLDSLGNQIFDQMTSSTLPESSISSAMLPVTSAATLATALNLMGVTAAIAAAISAVELLAGPTGPTGPTGAAGGVGPTGPTGPGNSATYANTNPGYWKDSTSGFMMAWGLSSLPSGTANINFAIPYSGVPAVSASVTQNGVNTVLRVVSVNSVGWTAFAEDTDNHGGVACAAYWTAMGF